MEEQGKSAKEIYQATGWFRGNENKWRYEISNEDSTIVDKVKGHSWDSIEAEINKRNIEKKLAYHQKRFDKNVLKDYEVLEKEQEFIRKYSEELAQINEILENSKVNLDVSTLYNSNLSFKDIYKLNEILQNDELFEAYPQLKEVNIHMPKSYYSPDNSGTLAFVTDNSATDIYLTERGLRNKEDLKSTLLHEIQHLIQHTEGFSSGASMENWYDYKRNEIDKKINTLNEKIEKQIGNEFVFWETAKRMYRLEELTTTIEKSKKEISKYEAAIERGDGWSYRFQAMIETAQVDIERAEIEYEAIEEALKTTIGENNLNEYKGYLEELKDYMLGRGTKAYELYKNTAGEIEAREVEKRIDYTAEQRKNEMPFVKDENTVYADFETDSQAKYSISATDNRRKLSISNPLAEKHYNKILQIFNENNGDTSLIDYIGANDVYKRDSQGNRVYKTFAEYENLANINKERELARQKFNEEENKRYEQRKQWEEQHKQEIMERDGISEQQYQKEREAEIYREEKQKELALLSREIRDKESGYHNNQKSIRAIRAELDGKFPLTVASKMLGVSEKSIKNNVVVSEWHHSGGEMYNEIDYYDISKYIDLADNGIDEYINDSNYQQEISNWLKMRNSTKTINDFTTDPDIRYSLSEDTEGRKLSKEQIERYKYVSEKLKDENGRLKPYYHGTQRADRVGTYFDPERATSGPMAFFTDSKEIGQNYSENKSDTSLSREYDTEYDLFKADGKDLDTYWNSLSKAEQQKINKEGNNVGFADDWENIVYGDRASENSFSDMYKWYLNNETNGNGIKALYNVWVQDGNIMGDDLYKFQEVLEKAGLKNVEFLDPYKVDSKVYEVYLNITNPFDTSDISEDIVQQFKEASKTATIGEQYSADAWDKTNITPEQWISKLESDIAENTTHAWTVIPDWVTSVLKKNGYDGIVDTGGKGGGVGHQVVIPFYSEQIKDVSNQQPTDNPNIDMSLSYDDEAPVKNPNLTYGEDIKYRVEEAIAPLQETIENLTEQVKAMQENIAPTSQEVVEQQGQESSDFLDAPIDKVFADFDYSTYYGKIQKERLVTFLTIYGVK